VTAVERLQTTGIRRSGSPKRGFRYRFADGRRVGEKDRRRIDALAIPPAWTDVSISPSSGSHLQAVGRDKAGRWQYRYSPSQTRIREARKLRRLRVFLDVLPKLRARVARDLRGPGLSRERVLGGIVQILLRCALRPGSGEYARNHATFGIATLRPGHARVENGVLTFRFPGKGRKIQEHYVREPRVLALVRALQRSPGRELFRWRGEDGSWVNVRRRHINDYIREATGGPFTAKDFRTWAGTLIGASALARAGYPSPSSARAIRSAIAAAMRETAAELGNTAAVCRASYVSPFVIEAFERGIVVPEPAAVESILSASSQTLGNLERALARLIDRGELEPSRAARASRAA
jgi:DNA topoisomerase-1